jgi:hypothetical protein
MEGSDRSTSGADEEPMAIDTHPRHSLCGPGLIDDIGSTNIWYFFAHSTLVSTENDAI